MWLGTIAITLSGKARLSLLIMHLMCIVVISSWALLTFKYRLNYYIWVFMTWYTLPVIENQVISGAECCSCLNRDGQSDWSSQMQLCGPHPHLSAWADLCCVSAGGTCFTLIIEKSHLSCWKEPGWMKDWSLLSTCRNLLHRLKKTSNWVCPVPRICSLSCVSFLGRMGHWTWSSSPLSMSACVQRTEPFCASVTSASKWWIDKQKCEEDN